MEQAVDKLPHAEKAPYSTPQREAGVDTTFIGPEPVPRKTLKRKRSDDIDDDIRIFQKDVRQFQRVRIYNAFQNQVVSTLLATDVRATVVRNGIGPTKTGDFFLFRDDDDVCLPHDIVSVVYLLLTERRLYFCRLLSKGHHGSSSFLRELMTYMRNGVSKTVSFTRFSLSARVLT
jgi:hypothetical protein